MEYFLKGKIKFLEPRLKYTMLNKEYKENNYCIIWNNKSDKTEVVSGFKTLPSSHLLPPTWYTHTHTHSTRTEQKTWNQL